MNIICNPTIEMLQKTGPTLASGFKYRIAFNTGLLSNNIHFVEYIIRTFKTNKIPHEIMEGAVCSCNSVVISYLLDNYPELFNIQQLIFNDCGVADSEINVMDRVKALKKCKTSVNLNNFKKQFMDLLEHISHANSIVFEYAYF